jgi:hypothetical protein
MSRAGVFCGLATSVMLFGQACAADPELDPGGWKSLKLGMTVEQVVRSLDGIGHVGNADGSPGVLPLGIDTIPDLPAAKKLAQQVLAEDKRSPGEQPEELLAACKVFLGLLKKTRWSYVQSLDDGPESFKKKGNVRAVNGVLESIARQPQEGPTAKQLVIRVNGKKEVRVYERALEDSSKQQLAQLIDSMKTIAAHVLPDSTVPKDGVVQASQIVLDTVDIRGVRLRPSLTFDSEGHLVRIVMATFYAGDGIGIDHHAMHRTLSDALVEKYGRPDERNDNGQESSVMWRFPKTFLKCYKGSQRDGAWVRQYVGIQYEVPNAENEAKDNL